MKLSLALVGLVAVLSLAGCAGNQQGLQAQVETLTKRAHEQDDQIAKLKEQSSSTASTAWDWTSQHAQDAWNSQFSQETRARFQKCWDGLKTGNK